MASVCGVEQAAQVLGVTKEDARQYVEQASSTSRDRLMAMLKRFLEAETEAKGYSQPRYALEAAALRCCQPPEKPDLGSLMERVARLEERKVGAAVPEGLEERLKRLEEGVRTAPPPGDPAPKENLRERKVSPAKPEKPREKPVPAEAQEIWKRTLDKFREQDISTFGLLRKGRLLSADDSHYVVVFDKEQGAINVKLFVDPEMRKKVETVLTEIAGVPSTFQAAVEGSFAERDENILRRQEKEKKADEERMDQVMQAFGRENVIVIP
jgi:DNA polymerase III gamma/tau subunit